MPRAEVIKLLDSVDKDCSGVVEFHEYIALMLDIRRGSSPTVIQSLNMFRNDTDRLSKFMARTFVSEWRESLAIKEDVEISDKEVLKMMTEDQGTLADWIQDYSLGEIYYYNKHTKESQFKIPMEVRYYVPLKIKRMFTTREMEKYRELFDEYDEDGSGTIGPLELKNMYEKLGETISKERLVTILGKVDINNDGELSFNEFVGMMLMFKLSNPVLNCRSVMHAAFHMLKRFFSSPKKAIKARMDETLEGSKLAMERSAVYKNVHGDDESHLKPLKERTQEGISSFITSVRESANETLTKVCGYSLYILRCNIVQTNLNLYFLLT
jgi:Ca2+-binding EF-hand superfamily protein